MGHWHGLVSFFGDPGAAVFGRQAQGRQSPISDSHVMKGGAYLERMPKALRTRLVHWLAALPVAALLVLQSPTVMADSGAESSVVVELFTSQGCSSCPPADKFLGELARRKNVIALSFHVDYWDYIGWPDPFATKETTGRQHAYGQALKQRYVYTPELVVDGQAHSSKPHEVERLILDSGTRPRLQVAFRSGASGVHEVAIPAGEIDESASIWLVFYDSQHMTRIPRGENRGRTLTYTNVVRELRHLGNWSGQAMTIPVSMDEAEEAGRSGCVVIVQKGRAGPVLGAARMAFDG